MFYMESGIDIYQEQSDLFDMIMEAGNNSNSEAVQFMRANIVDPIIDVLSKPSNKKEDFAIAAKSFNTNNENTINTLNHIVDSYFVAKGNSVTLINNEKDKL